MEFFVRLPVAGINAAIADHFVMLFGDMLDETPYELHDGKRFFHVFVIFMPVVMEGDKVTIVCINPGSGNHGSSEITPDIFYHGFGITFVWLCIDIKAFLVFPVTAGFHFFKGAPDPGFHFIEKCGAERITEESIVKVTHITPETVITVAALRDQAVDVWVPFQIPAKGMEDHDKTGSEIHGHVLFEKHS